MGELIRSVEFMAKTRQAVRKTYGACRNCEDDISGYGKCKKGYDNFYYRLSKNNGCDKCKDEKRERRMVDESLRRFRKKRKKL